MGENCSKNTSVKSDNNNAKSKTRPLFYIVTNLMYLSRALFFLYSFNCFLVPFFHIANSGVDSITSPTASPVQLTSSRGEKKYSTLCVTKSVNNV